MTITEILKKYIPPETSANAYGNLVVFEVHTNTLQSVCEKLFYNDGLPLKTVVATDERVEHGVFKIFYTFGVPGSNAFLAPYITLRNTEEFPSMTSVLPQVAFYEREIKEFFGLAPIGHPAPKRWFLHNTWPEGIYPLRKDFHWNTRPQEALVPYDFATTQGEGVFEIPVGPVHAGIIEPGHFRFSMAGEEIISLEPRLGFVHKGIEKLFETLPLDRQISLSEHVSGDTSFTHSLGFCNAIESLAKISVPERAHYLRVIYSELERLANHIGDVGLILLGTAFNFGSAQGARLREVVMQMHERLTGSRFLRGVNAIGGVTKDVNDQETIHLFSDLDTIQKEFTQLMSIVDKNLTIFNRLAKTGTLPLKTAKDLGAVGIVAKGSGIAMDARKDFPYAVYNSLSFEIETETSGDVYARFRVRVKEICSTLSLLRETLTKLPKGPTQIEQTIQLAPSSYAVSITEGWRGDIVYFVATDSSGTISRVHVRDASFLNWPLFIQFAPGNVVLDFPLMNKSCNLSYSGNDK